MYGAKYNIFKYEFQYFDDFIKQKLYSELYLEIYSVVDLPDHPLVFTIHQ